MVLALRILPVLLRVPSLKVVPPKLLWMVFELLRLPSLFKMPSLLRVPLLVKKPTGLLLIVPPVFSMGSDVVNGTAVTDDTVVVNGTAGVVIDGTTIIDITGIDGNGTGVVDFTFGAIGYGTIVL